MVENSRSKVWQDSLIAVEIFVGTFLLFWFAPIRQITDSNYSMLLSESLIHHRSFALDAYAIPRLKPTWHDNTFKNGEMYQLELVGPHLYYYLPPGSSILSIPYVTWMNTFGVSAANSDNTYNPKGEARIQRGLASLLMAGLACVFFFQARLFLSTSWSALIALGSTFGTQVFSTASRALWSDTWGILLLAVCLYLLVADAYGKRKLNSYLLATLLAWTYFVRPTNAISIAVVAIYLLLQRREKFLSFVVTGCSWLILFVAYSIYHFRQLLPNYFQPGRLNYNSFWTAFAGNLISPSRGLLIFVPVLLVLAYLIIRHGRLIFKNSLAVAALPVILIHMLTVAGFTPWNGGFCYGPRYSTGLVPWFALLGVYGLGAHLDAAKKKFSGTIPVGSLLLAVSIVINARGATSYETWMWNAWPDNVDKVPQKIWDWRRPQFLAGLVAPPVPEPLQVLSGKVEFGTAEADSFAWYGWSWGEKDFRWSDGKEAAIVFSVVEPRDSTLSIRLGGFVGNGKPLVQKVKILLNGAQLADLEVNEEPARDYIYRVERKLLRNQNKLVFKLPDAQSPDSLGISSDQRRLAVRVEWISLTASWLSLSADYTDYAD